MDATYDGKKYVIYYNGIKTGDLLIKFNPVVDMNYRIKITKFFNSNYERITICYQENSLSNYSYSVVSLHSELMISVNGGVLENKLRCAYCCAPVYTFEHILYSNPMIHDDLFSVSSSAYIFLCIPYNQYDFKIIRVKYVKINKYTYAIYLPHQIILKYTKNGILEQYIDEKNMITYLLTN